MMSLLTDTQPMLPIADIDISHFNMFNMFKKTIPILNISRRFTIFVLYICIYPWLDRNILY